MKCQIESLLKILPMEIRESLKENYADTLQEIRLRCRQPVEYVYSNEFSHKEPVTHESDLQFIVNAASRYSPWASETMSQGYLTINGGHRIGVCGEVICNNFKIKGFKRVESLCIRLSRDVVGIATACINLKGSLILIGTPGSGKTTMLRDLSRCMADKESIVVIDERNELFPEGFSRGKRMDVLTGCPKREGIEIALRTLCPDIIAVDEITAREDCEVIRQAAYCGVRFIATAHATTMEDLQHRPIYKTLMDSRIFTYVICLNKASVVTVERVDQ